MNYFKNWLFEQMSQEDYEKRKKKLEKMLAVELITQEEFNKHILLLNLERDRGSI